MPSLTISHLFFYIKNLEHWHIKNRSSMIFLWNKIWLNSIDLFSEVCLTKYIFIYLVHWLLFYSAFVLFHKNVLGRAYLENFMNWDPSLYILYLHFISYWIVFEIWISTLNADLLQTKNDTDLEKAHQQRQC